MCFYRWFVQPTHLCVAHSELHIVFEVFNGLHVVCGVVWCGGVVERILVSGGRVVDEVSEGGDVIGIEGSHSMGEKAVFQLYQYTSNKLSIYNIMDVKVQSSNACEVGLHDYDKNHNCRLFP